MKICCVNPCLFFELGVYLIFVRFRLTLRQWLYRLFDSRSVILYCFESILCEEKYRLRHHLRNFMSKLWKIRWKRKRPSNSLNFCRSRVYYFLPLWWSKKDEFLWSWPGIILFTCAWKAERCASGLAEKVNFCFAKTEWKCEMLSMGAVEKHTLVKIISFWTLKNSKQNRRPRWGTVENHLKIPKGTGFTSVFGLFNWGLFFLFKNRCWVQRIWRPSLPAAHGSWENSQHF